MHTIHSPIRSCRFLGAIVAASISLGLGVSGALSDELGPDPIAATGWQFESFMTDLYSVDNIIFSGVGDEIFATLESQSQGRIVRISNGEKVTLVSNLYRPDGLAYGSPYLYITEEVDDGRVTQLDLRNLSRMVLAKLGGPEGIDFLPDGSLVVAEDDGGRVLRVTLAGEIEVLVEGLLNPEGLAVSPDGTVYVAETNTGRILSIAANGMKTVVEGLNHPDQVEIASDGALWISEDAKPGRLLRYFSGRLEVIMAGLMAPQGIAFGRNGEIYVAEQKRNRILVLRRTAPE
jgi:DNA-binding beta-propeller fold protein YncE